MFRQHSFPDHTTADYSSPPMFPFYTLSSPYPIYPSFARPHPTNYHVPPPPPPPPRHEPSFHELFHGPNFRQAAPQPPHQEHQHEHDMESHIPSYIPRPSQTRGGNTRSYEVPRPSHPMKQAMHHSLPRQQPRPDPYPHTSYPTHYPSYYDHLDEYDQQPYHPYQRPNPKPTRGSQRTSTHPYASHMKYHEDGHGMGLPPFQREYDESDMYPPYINQHVPRFQHGKQHVPPFQHEWDDEHEDQESETESEHISSHEHQAHRQVPIRVIPVSFTNVPSRGPLRRRFLITHEPPHQDSDSEWEPSHPTSSSYNPQQLSALLQANPEAIRPLLLQLLPLYEPFLRQALKHDDDDKENKDTDKGNNKNKANNKVKETQQEKENKPAPNVKTKKADMKTNKANINNNATTSKPKNSTGPSKASNNIKPKITEPEIKKMTPPTTRVRIIHPVQEKEIHLDQSEAYTVPPPTQEEIQEHLPPPARPRQIYAYTAHHEEKEKEKDKKKEETTTTNTATQRNINIKATSTSHDIPIREKRGTTAAPPSSSTPSTTTTTVPPPPPPSTTRDIPIRERVATSMKPSQPSPNMDEKKQDKPKEPPKKVDSSEPPPTSSPPTTNLITPTPNIRRHSPTVEIEDVPPTPHHTRASPVHRHTESSVTSDSLGSTSSSATTTSTAAAPAATPTPTTIKEEKGEVKEENPTPEQAEIKTEPTTTTTEPQQQEATTSTTTKRETPTFDTPSDMSHVSPVSPHSTSSSIRDTSDDVKTPVDAPAHSSPTHSPHSPASSTYSSILQSVTESPNISAPTSPEHHRITSDHEWTFTSPLLKTAFLKKNGKEVDMKLIKEEKEYVVTITLPEHITKHDIRLDIDASGITVESRDDPPMFPSRNLSLPIDSDINNLSAKSELIDDFHTIIVKIPKKMTNKRPIRIE